MKNKKPFKERCKEFWTEEGPKIKIGLKCLAVGLTIGFVKGVLKCDEIRSAEVCRLIDRIPDGKDEDDFEYNESNTDDPELLELIRLEESENHTEKEEA